MNDTSSTSSTSVSSTSDAPSTTTTNTVTFTSVTSESSTSTMPPYNETKVTTPSGLSEGVIGGIVGGVIGLLVIVTVILLLLFRYRRKKKREPRPMLPNPYPEINRDPSIGFTSSTAELVRNDSLTPTSADSLPTAPPPPPQLDYEPTDPSREQELYVNQDADDPHQDYLEPSKWGQPSSDDIYIPMGAQQTHHTGTLEKPVPSSQLVSEYIDPSSHKDKPVACGGSVNKGYVNVPNSESSKAGTLPKYANLPGKEVKEEDEDLEDYENVPGAKAAVGADPVKQTRPKIKELSVGNTQRNASPKERISPKPKPKPKYNSETTPKSTPGSTPSSIPKVKHKTWTKPSANGEGAPDYVNVQKYSKKPHQKGHLDEVHFNKK